MKNNEELVIERRKFLKTSGAIAVGATFATLLPSNVVKASKRGGTLSMLVQPEVPTLASYLSTSMPVGQDRKSVV